MDEAFKLQVRQCAAELGAQLPAISNRHSPLALLAALAEYAGGSLQLLLQDGSCTPEQAHGVLARAQQLALESSRLKAL